LKNSLFLVHTCNPEGFSNIFIQAWLQAKPAVSLLFAPDGFIEKHQIGYFSRDMDAMCRQITRLIEDEPLRRAMGLRAQEVAGHLFHPENNVREFERFFKEVLNDQEK
jgi:glycosyltransferase involved in cell wall biosynthesis